jgi:hypothetical protein
MKIKGKFVPVQTIKSYLGNGGITPLTLNLDYTRVSLHDTARRHKL